MTQYSEMTWKIASLAHECWCRAMREAGWTSGDRFDEDRRVDDRLVPFEELPDFHKDELLSFADDNELEHSLVETAAHARWRRFTLPELTAGDMRVGRRVRFDSDDEGPILGRIRSWTVRDAQIGRLDAISVEWDDGTVTEYAACECELALAEEA